MRHQNGAQTHLSMVNWADPCEDNLRPDTLVRVWNSKGWKDDVVSEMFIWDANWPSSNETQFYINLVNGFEVYLCAHT